jgi:hypothetical protein
MRRDGREKGDERLQFLWLRPRGHSRPEERIDKETVRWAKEGRGGGDSRAGREDSLGRARGVNMNGTVRQLLTIEERC